MSWLKLRKLFGNILKADYLIKIYQKIGVVRKCL